MYYGDLLNLQPLSIKFSTQTAAGAPITLANGVVSVYKGNGTTETTSGVALTTDFDSRTGLHDVTVTTSANTSFFVTGADYDIVITSGTVDSVSVVGRHLGSFSIENRSATRSSVWTAAKAGYLDAAVTSRQASGNVTAGTIAAGAITSGSFAAGAIASGALSADTITRIQAGLALAATALSNAMWTDAKAGYLDAAVTSRMGSGATVTLATNGLPSGAFTAEAITRLQSGLALAATALSNATWTDAKAGYLDAAVTSRMGSGQAVTVDTNGIPSGAFTAEAITRLQAGLALASTALSNAVWTDLKAGYLDAAVTSRMGSGATVTVATNGIPSGAFTAEAITRLQAGLALAATALSNATWTDGKAGYLDAAITSRMATGTAVAVDTNGLPSGAFTAEAITRIQAGLALAATALSTAVWTNAKAGYLDAAITSRLASGDVTVAAASLQAISEDLLKRDWTGITGEAARSVLNALRALRNKISVSAGTLTVTKEDDTASAWTATVTSDASADPIVGVDPS